MQNFRRLNYLWKNKHGEFFNPFDKGSFHNFREALESTMPPSHVPNKEDIEQNPDLPISHPDVDAVINWRKIKIFSVMDIPNSPLKEILMEEFKKTQNGDIKLPNQKDNPFSAPFPNYMKGRNLEANKEEVKRVDSEETGLMVKTEEERANPFTN